MLVDLPRRKDLNVVCLRLFLSASDGGSGSDLLKSGIVEIAGTDIGVCDATEVVEPMLKRLDVVRYADCSG